MRLAQGAQAGFGMHPTFTMGRFVSPTADGEMRIDLGLPKSRSQCKEVTDKEQLDRDDYWQSPEDFEHTKKGIARLRPMGLAEVASLGYDARFVAGRQRRYGTGHAWAELQRWSMLFG